MFSHGPVAEEQSSGLAGKDVEFCSEAVCVCERELACVFFVNTAL